MKGSQRVVGGLDCASLRLSAALALAGMLAVSGSTARAGVLPVGTLLAGVPAQGSFGTIKGRLVYGGSPAPPAKDLVPKGAAQKDPAVCAAAVAIPDRSLVVDPKTLGVKYGFAYLVRPKGENPEAVKELVGKAEKVVLDQKNCEFIPYALAIHQDQTLVFKSTDPVNHNVHLSPFANAPFNQILAANGVVEKKLVPERRVIPVSCDIHPWMKAWIMVFDHPFFAITGDDGSFEIKGVPAGEQKLVVWQETVGYATPGLAQGVPVSVKAGEVTDVGEVKLDPAKVKRR
jgi:plastocyanin